MNPLLVYGAVTPPRLAAQPRSLTATLKVGVDRWRWRLGRRHDIDYRNHLTAFTFNRGDLAIAIGVEQMLRAVEPSAEVTFADWQHLGEQLDQQSVVVGGSGYFFMNGSGRLASRLQEDLTLLTSRRVCYGFYGVGLNQVHETLVDKPAMIDQEDVAMVRRLLSGASFVSVRDRQTLDALQPYADRPIFLSGDPALFLSTGTSSQPRRAVNDRPRIGINIPFHGPAATDRVRHDLPRYIDCFRRLQEDTQADLFQMVHFDTERLIGRLLQDAGIRVTIVDGSVETLQATYATLDLHVGGMLHSCILSCSVGTPCIGLAYDVKHFGFFDLMQMPDFCVPSRPFDTDTVLARCTTALQTGPELRAHITARREALRGDTEAYLRDVLPRLMHDT